MEPWALVIVAMGCIFFSYSTWAAFRRPTWPPPGANLRGHAQLDEFGFD